MNLIIGIDKLIALGFLSQDWGEDSGNETDFEDEVEQEDAVSEVMADWGGEASAWDLGGYRAPPEAAEGKVSRTTPSEQDLLLHTKKEMIAQAQATSDMLGESFYQGAIRSCVWDVPGISDSDFPQEL